MQFFTCVEYNVIKVILIVTEDSSETDELFVEAKEEIKELRSEWYSLAIELDIDYATRKVSNVYIPRILNCTSLTMSLL